MRTLTPVQPHLDVRRNQKCPCGSGKKAKRCCLPRLKEMALLPPVVRTQAIVAGILGHWPTVEPPAPVPEAVQQRFKTLTDNLAATTTVTTEIAAAPQLDDATSITTEECSTCQATTD